jgi:hypothetical protein
MFKALFGKSTGEPAEETIEPSEAQDVKEEEFADDTWVFVRHRGIVLPMRKHEKINLWDTMNREGRNEQVDAMKKAIKRGKIQEYWIDNATCLYVPKSADLVKVRNEYLEFKKGGGKFE